MNGWRRLMAVAAAIATLSLPSLPIIRKIPEQSKPSARNSNPQNGPEMRDSAIADAFLIAPGKSIGPLRLGDTERRFWELFRKDDPGTDEVTYPCNGASGNESITQIHWTDIGSNVDNGIWAYLRRGHIFQISDGSARYRTEWGVTVDSSPNRIRFSYAGLEAFWLTHSRSLATGDRDFIYWVDRRHGITFKFYYDSTARSRKIYTVDIFEPGEEFIPNGCLDFPRDWHRLAPYSLEPPRSNPKNQR